MLSSQIKASLNKLFNTTVKKKGGKPKVSESCCFINAPIICVGRESIQKMILFPKKYKKGSDISYFN